MGDKAFEQSAGFLRVKDGKNPLDNSAVHPESYGIVKKICKNLKCSVTDIIKNEALLNQIDVGNYITTKIGAETLEDIKAE